MTVTPDEERDRREPSVVPGIPRLPRILPGLAKLGLENAFVIDGAARNQVFHGKAATGLLPRLVDALDGTRDASRLAEHLQVPEGHIQDAVALLHTRGLLEEGADPPAPADPVPLWLGRALGTTGLHRSTAAVLARLAEARVSILGDPQLGTRLIQHLQALGVPAELSPSATDPRGAHSALVVAVAAAPEPVGWFGAIEERLRPLRQPWLRVLLDGSVLEIGPRFDHRVIPHYQQWQETRWPQLAAENPSLVDEALAVAATEILHLVAGIGRPQTLRGWLRFDLERWESQQLPIVAPPYPVQGAEPGSSPRVSMAVAVENMAQSWLDDPAPWREKSPRRGSGDWWHGKNYSAHRRRSLPDVHFECDPSASESASDPHRVARVLQFALCRRDDDNGRDARTLVGHDSGSVFGYLIALSPDGVPAGVHYYAPDEHALVTIREFTPEDVRQARQTMGAADPVLVVLTAGLSPRDPRSPALRAAVIDTGAAVHRIARAAASMGWKAVLREQGPFHTVSRLLQVDPAVEPVLTIVGLAAGEPLQAPTDDSAATTDDYREVSESVMGLEHAVETERLTPDRLVADLLAELHQHAPSPTLGAARRLHATRLPHEVAALPPRTLKGPARSAPLTQDALLDVLARADRASTQGWPDAERLPLSFVVLAHHVSGLEPGIYQYGPANTRRSPRRLPGALPTALTPLTGHPHACALLIVLAPLYRAVGWDGAHGYRRLLLRTAAAEAEASLVSAERELTAYRVAGVLPDDVRQWTGVDPRLAVPLTALALGPPPKNTTTSESAGLPTAAARRGDQRSSPMPPGRAAMGTATDGRPYNGDY